MTLFPYPPPFIDYLAEYFGSRDYFECHEIMEEYWKSEAGSVYEGCWLVLIRIAVVQYHARRGNGAGAWKLLVKAAGEIEPARMDELGLDGAAFAAMLLERIAAWGGPAGVRYADFALPIADAALLREAQAACAARGWTWGTPLAAVDDGVIHRHLRRDRSDVAAARAEAAKERTERRAGEPEG